MTFFYCCYLLQSEPKPQSFYIGSTPDPQRRIRQHNGELTQGAWRTKKSGQRPWKMICTVSGFQSRVSALQFEHAWQHAYQTRLIPRDKRIVASKTTHRSIHKHLGNLRLLAASPIFCRLPLKIRTFSESAAAAWTRNQYKIDAELSHVTVDMEATNSDAVWKSMCVESSLCRSSNLDPVVCAMSGACPRDSCGYTEPLIAFAKRFLSSDSNQLAVLPTQGTCPNCKSLIRWSEIVRHPSLD